MHEAIEKFVLTGECKINRSIAVEKWTLLCRIVKHNEEYKLVEASPKGDVETKVRISKEDSEYLIEELHLKYVPDEIFNHSGTYLSV